MSDSMQNPKPDEATSLAEIQKQQIDFIWGVKIPMRDGVHLNASLYKPSRLERVPAIFTLTPYIADSYHPRANYFARNGYAFALVDCRGRGNSEGDFEPFVNEGPDAYDVVEWLGAQPWCDGAVTMWGGSYAGFNQWMAVKEFPPRLKTVVPAAAAHAAVDFPFLKNIFYAYVIQWLTFTSGVTPNENLFQESSFWIEKFRELYIAHRPFKELDRIIGNTTTHFQTWLQHPTPDEYWGRMWLTPEDYRKVDLPILTITGHYDDDQPGALHYYRMHMQHGSALGCERHFLIVGPWDHPGTRTPNKAFGGLEFGEAGLLDLNELHRQWYDWILKGGARPEFLKKRVAYYLMGAEEWKYADRLEDIANATLRLYLNSQPGAANDVFHSGTLEEIAPADSPPDSFTYDPLDIRPAELEREEIKSYLTDQRFALNLFGNGLIYHSSPFNEDIEVTGFVRFEASIAMDVSDTDFQVSLSEVLLDGSQIRLTTDLLRARHRTSLKQERLVNEGEIERYVFDGFTFFSRRIAKGSRLRLVINCPNSIYMQKNYNSGGNVSEERAEAAHVAHIHLYHDAEHPSFLELPLVN